MAKERRRTVHDHSLFRLKQQWSWIQLFLVSWIWLRYHYRIQRILYTVSQIPGTSKCHRREKSEWRAERSRLAHRCNASVLCSCCRSSECDETNSGADERLRPKDSRENEFLYEEGKQISLVVVGNGFSNNDPPHDDNIHGSFSGKFNVQLEVILMKRGESSINPMRTGLLGSFCWWYEHTFFTDLLHSTCFVDAILIYTINPWVLMGYGGLGRAFL